MKSIKGFIEKKLNAIKRGILIVVDGGEGSSKGTNIKKAKKYWGNQIVTVRDPGGSPYAEDIRYIIRDSLNAKQANGETMFFLFWAARLDLMKNTIIPALNAGKIVICDRFDSSTFAYQITAQKQAGLTRLFWDIRLHHLGDYRPDLYVHLDLDPEIGLARKKNQKGEKKNHFDKRKLQFHKDVREGFKEFFSEENHGINSVTINAENSKKEVWEDFKKIIDAQMKKRR
jgi:dTMP kinase